MSYYALFDSSVYDAFDTPRINFLSVHFCINRSLAENISRYQINEYKVYPLPHIQDLTQKNMFCNELV